ncbi:hypothetical protein Tcan_10368 [Toxocara canis]|uniref:Uncharacterized protein n=1 Tax=Toxocara canis TaxID=6265 RepID=A0A0B2VRV1_TOXCA|nr:hypothetical protein Tcan_10368 [Toxocara canis]
MSRLKGLQERLDALKREEQMLLRLRELLGQNYTALMMEQEQLMALLDDKESVQAHNTPVESLSSAACAAVAKEEGPMSPPEVTFATATSLPADERSDHSILKDNYPENT